VSRYVVMALTGFVGPGQLTSILGLPVGGGSPFS
jgi:hypothetical protein